MELIKYICSGILRTLKVYYIDCCRFINNILRLYAKYKEDKITQETTQETTQERLNYT